MSAVVPIKTEFDALTARIVALEMLRVGPRLTALETDNAMLKLAVAALTSPVPIPLPAPSILNVPTGFTLKNDQPWSGPLGSWNVADAAGWYYFLRAASKANLIVSDPTAPRSPPSVLDIIFTPDMGANNEPGVNWLVLPNYRAVHLVVVLKLSPGFVASDAGACKVNFLRTASGAVYTGLFHPTLDGSIKGPPFRLCVNTEWAPYGQRIWEPQVFTPIPPGAWTVIEFLAQYDPVGRLRWWVNGILNGDYTVSIPDIGFMQVEFAPTVQDAPTIEQHLYIDHTQVWAP